MFYRACLQSKVFCRPFFSEVAAEQSSAALMKSALEFSPKGGLIEGGKNGLWVGFCPSIIRT